MVVRVTDEPKTLALSGFPTASFSPLLRVTRTVVSLAAADLITLAATKSC